MSSASTPTSTSVAPSSLKSTLNQLGSSPFPSAVFGTILALKGVMVPDHVISVDVEGKRGGAPLREKSWLVKPSRASCLTFGAANLIGTYMILVGQGDNGAGFNFAWNTLYLIVNGKQAVQGLAHGHIVPAALSAFALGNVGIYGKKYFGLGKFI